MFVGMSVISFFEVAFLIFNLTLALLNSLIIGPKRILGFMEKKDYPSNIKMEQLGYHLKVKCFLDSHYG